MMWNLFLCDEISGDCIDNNDGKTCEQDAMGMRQI